MRNEITLITGAGSGIGLAIADKFYKKNHNIILLVKTFNQKKDLEKRYNKKLVKIYHGDLSNNFLMTQIFTKKMIKKKIKGSIINLSSQLGHIGAYNRTVYCSSKFAVEGFTKAAAMDLGKYGIRINTIAPTKTIVNEKELIFTKKRLTIIKNKIPLKKFTEKEDIAELCLFLTSSASKNITGSSIKIDGGWTAGK
jgi:NAD(P)-dependent dehydrogenase (short-subunit alcohol dehydrogenase family)